jgi:hypothetical protein
MGWSGADGPAIELHLLSLLLNFECPLHEMVLLEIPWRTFKHVCADELTRKTNTYPRLSPITRPMASTICLHRFVSATSCLRPAGVSL